MNLIDGSAIAKQIQTQIGQALSSITHRKPCLAFILVGNHSASLAYIRMKKKRCQEVGISSFDYEFPETLSEEALLKEIDKLNRDPLVDGILVQLPLPAHIETLRIVSAIDPEKDVD